MYGQYFPKREPIDCLKEQATPPDNSLLAQARAECEEIIEELEAELLAVNERANFAYDMVCAMLGLTEKQPEGVRQ